MGRRHFERLVRREVSLITRLYKKEGATDPFGSPFFIPSIPDSLDQATRPGTTASMPGLRASRSAHPP